MERIDRVDLAMVAPLPEEFARFAWIAWIREHGGATEEGVSAFVRAVRSFADEIEADYAGRAITTGMLRARVGVSMATLSDWERRGLFWRSRYKHPEYAQAVAILIMRRLFPDKRRNWLPSYMPTPHTEALWWCYDLDISHQTWRQVMVSAPPLGLRVTPWTGATHYGWHRLPNGGAMDISGMVPELSRVAMKKLASVRTDEPGDNVVCSI